MYHCFYRYLEHFKILYPLLFGFREKSSTMHALISVTEYIHRSIDNNEVGCGIFIDLKKKKVVKQLSSTIMELEAVCMNGVSRIYHIESNL